MKQIRLVLASRNQHKIKELNAMLSELLGDVMILSLDDVGLYGDVDETGETYEENALLKAHYAARSGEIAFADDSGLSVNALGGAPGVLSARYAGGHGDDAKNRALLLQHLEGTDDRSAAFVCCIACVLPDGTEFTLRGTAEGEILTEERGEGGFGYDNLFYYAPYGKTFAEISSEEKNAVSHRRRAVEAFAERLGQYLAEKA